MDGCDSSFRLSEQLSQAVGNLCDAFVRDRGLALFHAEIGDAQMHEACEPLRTPSSTERSLCRNHPPRDILLAACAFRTITSAFAGMPARQYIRATPCL